MGFTVALPIIARMGRPWAGDVGCYSGEQCCTENGFGRVSPSPCDQFGWPSFWGYSWRARGLRSPAGRRLAGTRAAELRRFLDELRQETDDLRTLPAKERIKRILERLFP
jgi:hypothetical protein